MRRPLPDRPKDSSYRSGELFSRRCRASLPDASETTFHEAAAQPRRMVRRVSSGRIGDVVGDEKLESKAVEELRMTQIDLSGASRGRVLRRAACSDSLRTLSDCADATVDAVRLAETKERIMDEMRKTHIDLREGSRTRGNRRASGNSSSRSLCDFNEEFIPEPRSEKTFASYDFFDSDTPELKRRRRPGELLERIRTGLRGRRAYQKRSNVG